jgi:hypothetical protein
MATDEHAMMTAVVDARLSGTRWIETVDQGRYRRGIDASTEGRLDPPAPPADP